MALEGTYKSDEKGQVSRLLDTARAKSDEWRAKSDELRDQVTERDILHPGAEELPSPARGELFSAPSRWKKPGLHETYPAEEPLVSVIVPIYNKQNILRRCLESVLGQTHKNLQIILVDDGSTDESLAVTSWLTRHDPRVRVVAKQNGGVSSARNAALPYIQGDWIYFCDADDWLEPRCIEQLVGAAVKNGADMAICDFYRVRGNRYYTQCQTETGVYTLSLFVEHMTKRPGNYYYGVLWNKLFRASLFTDLGLRFSPTIPYGEDHMLILDFLMGCERIAVVGEPLYYYVDSPGSLMHQGLNPSGIAKNKTTVVEKYALLCEHCGLAETASDILRIASFLVTPATDGMVMPFDKVLRASQVPCYRE